MIHIPARGAMFALSLAVLAVLTAGSDAGGGKKVYKSPQDVFDAAKAALDKKDIKAFAGCLTEDSRDQFAGGMMFVSLMMKGFTEQFGKDEDKAKLKELNEILSKHGITEEFIKSLPKPEITPKDKKPDREELTKAMRKLLTPVKDRSAFIADMIGFLDRTSKKSGGGFNEQIGANPMLKDVKIEGDTAKGVIVATRDGKEVRTPVEFKREGGGWKIDLPMPEAKKK